MCDKIICWRGAGSNLANFKSISELGPVSNFAANKSDWKKKAYVKQDKPSRSFEKSVDNRRCLICNEPGHLVRDCQDPHKEALIHQRRNRNNKKYSERRGRSNERNPRERSRERSASRDKERGRDNSREQSAAEVKTLTFEQRDQIFLMQPLSHEGQANS